VKAKRRKALRFSALRLPQKSQRLQPRRNAASVGRKSAAHSAFSQGGAYWLNAELSVKPKRRNALCAFPPYASGSAPLFSTDHGPNGEIVKDAGARD